MPAKEHSRPLSTQGWLRSSEHTFYSCSIQRLVSISRTEGKKRLNKEWKCVAGLYSFMETNNFGNSNVGINIVKLCLNEYRWVAHTVGFFHWWILYAKMCHFSNQSAACWTRILVKVKHSMWKHKNKIMIWQTSCLQFVNSQPINRCETSKKQLALK